jgi:hypothetical protein
LKTSDLHLDATDRLPTKGLLLNKATYCDRFGVKMRTRVKLKGKRLAGVIYLKSDNSFAYTARMFGLQRLPAGARDLPVLSQCDALATVFCTCFCRSLMPRSEKNDTSVCGQNLRCCFS